MAQAPGLLGNPEICAGPCQAGCSPGPPRGQPLLWGPIGTSAGITSPLSRVDVRGIADLPKSEGRKGLEVTLLVLRDGQEEKVFHDSVGRKGPSSGPPTGVGVREPP